jgi:hypothetical protein
LGCNYEYREKEKCLGIMAGQSNMAGHGLIEPQDTIPSQRILAINKNGQIVIAKEPLAHDLQNWLDCGLSLENLY